MTARKPAHTPAPAERQPLPRLSMSVQEAAEATGLSKSYLYVLMEEGRLRYLKAGKRRLVAVTDLQAYLASLSRGPAAA